MTSYPVALPDIATATDLVDVYNKVAEQCGLTLVNPDREDAVGTALSLLIQAWIDGYVLLLAHRNRRTRWSLEDLAEVEAAFKQMRKNAAARAKRADCVGSTLLN